MDTAYDGQVFCAVADLPRRRRDMVEGSYTIGGAGMRRSWAVRITDVFGDECLVMRRV